MSGPFATQTYERDEFVISTDPARLDVTAVHHFLTDESYWKQGVSREQVERGIRYSLCYGIYDTSRTPEEMAGFARVITDYTTFAYIADVFVPRPYRGQGLGKWLIECILAHPEIQTLRKWTLDTQDAHELYSQFGFRLNPTPERHMIFRPGKPQPDNG